MRHMCGPALMALVVSFSASAEVLIFNGFADTSLLNLNGSAATALTADGTVLRVTPASGGESGSAFSLATVDATTFSTHFRFRITEPGGDPFDCNIENGADGLVFVVQSISSSVGGGGEGIGYDGIDRSVGVEFDTWCNEGNNDPSSNHIAIDVNGSVYHKPRAPYAVHVEEKFDGGQLWYAWVDYDGTTMRAYVSLDPVQPFQPILTRNVDVKATLEQPTGFVGFTSGTGADWGNHDIVYWEYTPYSPVCIGDFDGNGLVNAVDLGILLGAWGLDLDQFDLNGDNTINGIDVGIFLGNWGPCAP
ncbi:MAG: hypothetical protein JNL80_04790 [Phycisphaerae bacterium]|jgi:hypothetical protein|nr:hypothetical protein [Phycisphaerae bacterium]